MGCGLSINISYGRWTKERLLRLPGPEGSQVFATNGSATPCQKTGTKKAPLLATNARNGAPRPFHKPQKWATRQDDLLAYEFSGKQFEYCLKKSDTDDGETIRR